MSEPTTRTACEVRMHQTSIRQTTLDGQRAIVTGANSGIGEAIARGLAEAGAAVVVNYVTGSDRAETIVADIRKAGGRAIAVHADVLDEGLKVKSVAACQLRIQQVSDEVRAASRMLTAFTIARERT
jgi:NAD(P)-dependent dehydrogenase (short-subunit alcohol dehydrogenase family)